ncbi:MAG TPA: NnrU family protein [Xanthomonadaceae bacterium]|nr:NnrU family protein [Xanthomonadaceae bacterium]
MYLLIAGLVLFIGIHLVPWFPPLRKAALSRLGRNGYRGLYSLLALAGLVLVVIGWGRAEYQGVYVPPTWGRHLTYPLLLAAFILLPAAHMKGNIKRFTRHPMLWGAVLWALGHLLVRGDLKSLVLFGGIAAYSLLAMVSANARGAKKQEERYPLKRDLMVVAAGVVAFVAFVFLHPYLIGVAVIPR